MGFWAVTAATCLYLTTAISRAIEGDKPGVVIWTGYALANCGFMLAYWNR